ncbi:MAG: hypothetical protein IJL58_00780 [Bacteroidales bacterium]|nr:hypothetical protein [Bacteroidales bacterium]
MIESLGGLLTLWVIAYNLMRYIDLETVHSLGYLRELLNTKEKKIIHNYLLDPDDIDPIIKEIDRQSVIDSDNGNSIIHSNIELFDYLGTIELGAIMLDRSVINEEEFENQFGYRIENIRRYINKNSKFMEHICDEENNYVYLKRILKEY